MTAAAVVSPPVRFCFGVHLHQPVGNFDSVFEEHVRDVYLPFLEAAAARRFLPLSLHISGPLLEWMEAHDSRYLDLVGRLVADGQVELLLAGMYEPVLVALPREDRIEQIGWLRDALAARFGVQANGLWLTERVWESELAADLHDAGVRYAIVDDRHFLVTGIPRERLHAPLWTESGGKRLALFAIDERLRYLIPFQPPRETAEYLRSLRAAGHRVAVLADDGEKFGGWPGTRKWVYTDRWLEHFFDAMDPLVYAGEVQLSTFGDALDSTPSGGLAYLGTASYREMEAWSLPVTNARRLEQLESEIGEQRMAGPDGALVRGAHWRNFMVKYAESNRMHKKMLALSAKCRAGGDPPAARRAVARAQCNDAYWHGVFGGLYLPHLRDAVWRELAIAERELRAGEPLCAELLDFDGDGHDEVWVHSSRFSAVVSPHRGGVVEEWTLFDAELNIANTLTRRLESYHQLGAKAEEVHVADDAAPSIHDLEAGFTLTALPPVDRDDRALFVDRVLDESVTRHAMKSARFTPVQDWARVPMTVSVEQASGEVTVLLTHLLTHGSGAVEKRLRFSEAGEITASWTWPVPAEPTERWFVTELSVARPVTIVSAPEAREWRYEIETVAKSERGLDRTVQGEAIVLGWPMSLGGAAVALRLAPPRPGE